MPRPLPFSVPVLAMFLLAAAWLLLGAHVRQLQAHARCQAWPDCFRTPVATAPPAETLPADADGIVAAQGLAEGLVATALAALAGLGWRQRRSARDPRWVIPAAGVALVASASAARRDDLGMVGEFWQLPAALAVCALLWWLLLREQRFWRPVPESVATRALRPRVLAALGLTLFATLLGGWAGVHAIGLPCPDFPTCRGEWWPAGSLIAAVTATAAQPDEATARALAASHRLAALPALIYVMWLGLHLWRTGVRDHLCRYGLLVLGALLVAVTVGIMGVVTRLPPVTAVAHSAASALLILSLVTLYHAVQPATRPGKTRA